MKTSFASSLTLTAAFVLLGVASLPAQAQTVSGTLYDGETHEPIPGANVVLLRADTHAYAAHAATRPNGTFQFAQVPTGRYVLRTTVLGYIEDLPRVAVRSSQAHVALGTVLLTPLAPQLSAGHLARLQPRTPALRMQPAFFAVPHTIPARRLTRS